MKELDYAHRVPLLLARPLALARHWRLRLRRALGARRVVSSVVVLVILARAAGVATAAVLAAVTGGRDRGASLIICLAHAKQRVGASSTRGVEHRPRRRRIERQPVWGWVVARAWRGVRGERIGARLRIERGIRATIVRALLPARRHGCRGRSPGRARRYCDGCSRTRRTHHRGSAAAVIGIVRVAAV